MIDFLPVLDNDFDFSPLFQHFEEGNKNEVEFGVYPFSKFRYFFWDKESLRPRGLNIDETKIEDFDMFKNIFIRGDYFYLIAYHYFINVKEYEFEYKVEGKMRIEGEDGELKMVSFFEPLYNALLKEKIKSQTLLRHEYILSKNKFNYINKLTELLLSDYNDLDDAIRREKNVFSKYGITVKEIYLDIFRDFYSNFVDYLSKDNFNALKKLVYPSKKEIQSFQIENRPNFKKGLTDEARKVVINSIKNSLIGNGFISNITTYEQVDDLFNNRRRERDKIIWLKTPSLLRSFYKVLNDKNIISSTNNTHWKILSDFFIYKDNAEVNSDKLKDLKYSTNQLDVLNIENSFRIFDEIVSIK
ncbi:hypothetical protein [Chryseobacterium sp. OSA05B]|uniref:hypothetical protein n=1 Tax=Chryseobacterium sp. OSA05B TaxID=2862650 RepID=UPI001CC19573|nr:hypothetical protein [Chryseobacterium sp. OSA05B]